MTNPKIVLLAGGVGGAKMAKGLAQIVPPEDLFIVVNTADDFEHLGLYLSPDLDTIMYALAGVNNTETGWGRADETWHTLETLTEMQGPSWFQIGDKDLATHLMRTQWQRGGYPLSWITAQLCRRMRVKQTLMPMTDSPVRTIVHTAEGKLAFQDYFVRRRCEPVVQRLEFEGAESAESNRDILNAIRMADVIVYAPSNPLLSIDPILALPGMRRLLSASRTAKIAVSPIVGGEALKGPAAKIMSELNMEVSPFGVAHYLQDVINGFIFDNVDAIHQQRISSLPMRSTTTDTIMKSPADMARLARELLTFALE